MLNLPKLNDKLKRLWRLWAKSLGEKSGTTNAESDRIAIIRTVIVLTYIVTNFFIVAGVIRHW
jgi:hypothetical protein